MFAQTSGRRSKAPFEGEAFGHRRQPDEVDRDHPGPFLLLNIDDGEADANRLVGFKAPDPRSPRGTGVDVGRSAAISYRRRMSMPTEPISDYLVANHTSVSDD